MHHVEHGNRLFHEPIHYIIMHPSYYYNLQAVTLILHILNTDCTAIYTQISVVMSIAVDGGAYRDMVYITERKKHNINCDIHCSE